MPDRRRWRTWDEVEADAKAAGRIDEDKVAEHRERMQNAERAYRLAEIRRRQGLTQRQVALMMHVSQRRVSAVERGELTRSELGTVEAYVRAIGGRVKVVAEVGDEQLTLG